MYVVWWGNRRDRRREGERGRPRDRKRKRFQREVERVRGSDGGREGWRD